MTDKPDLTRGNRQSWIDTIWEGLAITADVVNSDEEWDEICTAMAWITEELGLDASIPAEPATPDPIGSDSP